jgi:hypothetical protein
MKCERARTSEHHHRDRQQQRSHSFSESPGLKIAGFKPS